MMNQGCLSALVLSLGMAVSGLAEAGPKSASSLFPVPACEVRHDRETLATQVRGEYRPTGDGSIPWLSLVGTWVDEKRGIIVQFQTEPFSNNKFGIARITLKNLCTLQVIAKGARLVTEEDLDAEVFEASFGFYGYLRHSQISILLDMNPEGIATPYTRVRFKRMDLTKPKIVDEFWLQRP